MEAFLKLLIIVGLFPFKGEMCTLPLSAGKWYTSTHGTWTVSADQKQILNFKAHITASTKTVDLDCVNITSNMYMLMTKVEIFTASVLDLYTCIEFTELNNITVVYYVVTPNIQGMDIQFTNNITSACTNDNYRTSVNRHVAVLALEVASAGTKCPNVILGKYNVEYESVNGTLTGGVFLDVCGDLDKSQLNFSETRIAFTAGSVLTCLSYVKSGSYTYLHTLNKNIEINSNDTYRFACWVIAKAYNGLKATVYPNECVSGQTPTNTPYGGQLFRFNLTSPSDLCGDRCLLPLTAGTWYTSTRGTWTVSPDQQQIRDFKEQITITGNVDLDCVIATSNMYTLVTNVEIFGFAFDLYTCIEFTESNNITAVYSVVTPELPGQDIRFTLNETLACTNDNHSTSVNRHVAILASEVASAGSKCPDVILGKYDVEYESVDGTLTSGVYLEVCGDVDIMQLKFSKTGLAFTAGNVLTCLTSVTSGSYTYLHTLNKDADIDNNVTYRFACWIIYTSDRGLLKATVYPNECMSDQTPTSTPYGGQLFTLRLTSSSDLCGESHPATCCDSNKGLIIGVTVGCVLLIVIIVGVTCLYIKKRNKILTVIDPKEAKMPIYNLHFRRQITHDRKFDEESTQNESSETTNAV